MPYAILDAHQNTKHRPFILLNINPIESSTFLTLDLDLDLDLNLNLLESHLAQAHFFGKTSY